MKTENKQFRDLFPLIGMLVIAIIVVVIAHAMMNSGPVITVQPEDVTVSAVGEKATVSVKAKGDDLTYQWYVKNQGGEKFNKSKIKKDTYSVKMTEKRNGRQLYCVVTDQDGKTVQSNTVTIAIAGTEVVNQP